MQIIQVRGEAQSLDGAIDVGLYVRGRIGDFACWGGAEAVEAAF
jgi:hypothetical protein